MHPPTPGAYRRRLGNTAVALPYFSSPARPLLPPEPEPEAEEISAESGDYAAQFQAKFFGA